MDNNEVVDITQEAALIGENPIKETEFKLLQKAIFKALSTLPDQEQLVLKMRFGFDDSPPLTLEKAAKYFNVTSHRIKQIEAMALRRLRHPKRSRILKDYLDLEN